MGPAETSITSMDRTMAVTMMDTWLAMPTAVITESSEKTMSSTRICASTHRRVPRCPAGAVSACSASTLS